MNNRKVFITGGSRGIGKEIARIYQEKGFIVTAPTRQEMDLSNIDSVRGYFKIHKNEGYDIVINNAGCNYIREIDDLDDKLTEQMINTNLVAPMYILKELVPYMKKNSFGRIVNIGSIWGVVAKPGRSVYSATKHAIHGITMTLADELAQYRILINTIAPGQTETELTIRNNSADDIEKMKENIPLGRLAKPIEIAKAVYWIGSEENTYITGQQIVVDGGLTIR